MAAPLFRTVSFINRNSLEHLCLTDSVITLCGKKDGYVFKGWSPFDPRWTTDLAGILCRRCVRKARLLASQAQLEN